VAAVVVVVAPLLLFPQNSLLTSLASAPDSSVSKQNFTVGFLKFYSFFSGHCSIPTIVHLVQTTMYDSAQFPKRNTSQI